MRLNRLWIAAAVVALGAVFFLVLLFRNNVRPQATTAPGLIPDATAANEHRITFPAMYTPPPGAEKTAAESGQSTSSPHPDLPATSGYYRWPGGNDAAVERDVAVPGPKAADVTESAPGVSDESKAEQDLGSKTTKKAARLKDVAKPPRAAKIAPRPTTSDQQESNQLRTTAATTPEGNPVRPDALQTEERAAYEAALRAQDAETAKSRKSEAEDSTAMEAAEPGAAEPAEPTMAAPPDEAESAPPTTVPAPVAADETAESTAAEPKPEPEDINEFLKMAEDRQKDYTVVKVYYGTDRAALAGDLTRQAAYRPWLIRTLASTAIVLLLSLLAFRLLRRRVLRVLAYCGMFATAVLGSLTICAWFQSRLPDDLAKLSDVSVSYGPERGKLQLGTCEVSIPKLHEVGQLESPSVLRLEFREDTSRHVVLLGVQREQADRFYADLHDCVGRSQHKSAFVFVHGYNVSFEDAARRTAQIAYDLKFDGAPIFFSWPSQAGILQYTVDENNVSWSAPHLLNFLIEVARQSGAERIHLIAHSMGNRALTAALRDLSLMKMPDMPSFNEVILTAPDIDADTFINDVAPAIVKTAQRVTLYASSNDEALIISKKVHGYPRAGDSGSQLIVLRGIDTVDVSAVDTSLIGHTYYGDNSSVLADIFELLNASRPADQRRWLRPERLGLLRYWVFHR